MSDLGDIGNILDEQHLSKLDWLDIDEQDYRKHEILPQDPHESIPELEEQWIHLSENAFHLTTDNTPYDAPQASREVVSSRDIDQAYIVTRKLVQAGLGLKQIMASLQKKFPPSTISASRERIKSALEERGLLGHVYVDSNLFPACDKRDVPRGVIASTDAVYVKAKDKCGGCIHNQKGRCAVFHKEIVMDVEYNQDLLDMYADKMKHAGKKVGTSSKLSPKERLRAAILASSGPKHTPLDSKPVISTETGMSYNEAHSALKSAKQVRDVITSEDTPYHWEGVKDKAQEQRVQVAKKMLSGKHTPSMKEIIASNPSLAPLIPHINLMGNLYLHMGAFANDKEASEHLKTASLGVPFVVGTPGDGFGIYVIAGMHEEVARRCVLNKYGSLEGKDSYVRKVASALKQKSDVEFLGFAQKTYAVPLSKQAKAYETNYILPKRMGYREAYSAFKKAHAGREVVADRKVAQKIEDTVIRMLSAKDTVRVATLVQADTDLEFLASHNHVLGHLYIDTSIVSEALLSKMATVRPELQHLPVLSDANRFEFFTYQDVRKRIASRVAAVKGVPATDSFVQKVARALGQLSNEKVLKFAQDVYARPVKKEVATHAFNVKGHYGQVEEKFDHKTARALVNAELKARQDAISKVRMTSEGGASGLDQMADIDLTPNHLDNIGDIDLHSERPGLMEDVDLSGGFIL